MPLNRSELAVIHVAKNQLGLSENNYRELLMASANVTSAKDLDREGFLAVMARLEAAGFKNAASAEYKRRERIGVLSPAQEKKIRSLEKKLGWDANPERLRGFIRKYSGAADIRFLGARQAWRVIEGLKAMAKRPNLGGEGD